MSTLKGSEVVISFLGTGSSIPPIGRQQVSFALIHQKGTLLFDCGEGTQYQIRKQKISTSKEFIIIISHLHSDHTLGIPGLLASFGLQGRSEKVKIIGPSGINDYLKHIMYVFNVGVNFEIEVIEMKVNDTYKGLNYKLLSHKAIHDAPGGALSYIWIEEDALNKFNTDKLDELEIPRGPHLKKLQRGESIEINGLIVSPEEVMFKGRRGRVVAYSGDTSPNIKFSSKMPTIVDLLVHEGSFPNDMEELAFERGHSTFLQAANIAKLGNVKQLILTHISPRFTPKKLKSDLSDAKKIFPNSRLATEGVDFIIELPDLDPTIRIN